ncbi:MAG TPA: hypothetical protein VEA69_00860 [Tepidisphaeraceae bacterium]|nr:hypothetical protein [Tepidisphaeraceae bacterium]
MSSANAPDPIDFPDFPPLDDSGTVDLWQIRSNLSLTPEQRMEQYFQWMEFVRDVREAGARYYGVEPRSAETSE